MRLVAIVNALDGLSGAEAARLAGMERQALRDAVLRDNAEGQTACMTGPARAGRRRSLVHLWAGGCGAAERRSIHQPEHLS
jgi:hypothetical protein